MGTTTPTRRDSLNWSGPSRGSLVHPPGTLPGGIGPGGGGKKAHGFFVVGPHQFDLRLGAFCGDGAVLWAGFFFGCCAAACRTTRRFFVTTGLRLKGGFFPATDASGKWKSWDLMESADKNSIPKVRYGVKAKEHAFMRVRFSVAGCSETYGLPY